VDQEEGQDTVPVVDHEVVGHATALVVVVAAVAETGTDVDNYTMAVWGLVLHSFRRAVRA